jgi:glycosyltransferase involved in cell wall biosynthesis
MTDTPGDAPYLSLVIPAYNEAGRIGGTLAACVDFLSARPYSWEIVVADDGSIDATAEIARAFAASHGRVRVVSIAHGGKAAALRAGMLAAQGELIAFSDADLATPLSYLDEFVHLAQAGADIVAGSREGATASRIGEPWHRHAMGRVFNRLVQFLLIPGVDDTQCGFKLFTRPAIRQLLETARLYKNGEALAGARVTAFDVELFAIARLTGMRIVMVPVKWTYGEHSKVNPATDSFHNLRDVITVFINAKLGRYGAALNERERAAKGADRSA